MLKIADKLIIFTIKEVKQKTVNTPKGITDKVLDLTDIIYLR